MFRLFSTKCLFTAIFFIALLLLTFFYRGDHVSTKNNQTTAAVAPITVVKNTPTLSTDNNGNGVVNPGDTLTYTVTVSNGATNATGVIFTDVLDSNLTLVPGSVNSSPIATNDSFNVLGNVNISVPMANGVKVNDLDPDGTTPTITGFGNSLANSNANAPGSAATSANGGNITLTADGSFTYNPPAGFEGADSFFYTLSDGTASDTAQVTLNISGMIWFIKNDAAACTTLATGCGRLSNPFSSLASFASINNGTGNNPAANDNIFIYTGSGSYDASLTLLNNQKLIGQGASATLQSISGVTVPSFSAALPATGGTNPTLISTTGNALNLASGNNLRGLTVGSTTSSKLNASGNVGTLTIGPAAGTSDVTLNGTGQAINLTGGGTLAARFAAVSANGGTNGIVLTGMGGNLESSTTTIQNSTGTGISVSNSVTGGTFNFVATTLSGTAGTGVLLSGNANNLTFAALNITPNSGQRAFHATNNTGTISSTSGTISTTNNIAVEVVGTSAASRTPLNMQLTSVSASGASNGIILQNTSDGGNGFRVLGNGSTDGSGGTIQNITNRGASFIDAADIQLNNMIFNNVGTTNGADPTNASSSCGDLNQTGTNTGCNAGIHAVNVSVGLSLTNIDMNGGVQQGINGDNVTNFTLSNSNVLNFGDQVRESGIKMNNLLGTSSITNTTVSGNEERQIEVQNDSGTLTNFTVSSVIVRGSSVPNGAQGILFSGSGTASMKMTVTNSTFGGPNPADYLRSTCIQTDVQGGSPTMEITVTGSTFQEGGATLGAAAIDIIQAFSGNVRFNISNNPTFLNLGSHVININQQTTSTNGSLLQGKIENNTIGNTTSGTSGTVAGSGVRIRSLGQGTTIANVISNTIRGVTERGIFAELAEGTTVNNTLHTTITNNFVNLTDGGADRGILVHAGIATTADDGVACADISGNNATSAGVTGDGIRVRQREKPDLQMPGYTGGLTDSTAVINYLTPRNPATTDTFSASAVPVGDPTACFKNTPGPGNPCTQPSLPSFAPSIDDKLNISTANFENKSSFLNSSYQTPAEMFASIEPIFKQSINRFPFSRKETISSETAVEIVESIKAPNTNYLFNVGTFFGNISSSITEITNKLGSLVSPTVHSQQIDENVSKAGQKSQLAGETVCVDGDTNPACSGAGFTIPANESTTITFRATVNANSTATTIPNTANVTAAGGINQNSNTVNTTVVQPPSAAKDFVATFISIGGTTNLDFTITNPNSTNLTGVSLTDVLPTGLSVANSTTSVCGGTNNLVVTAATRTIQLMGATVAANNGTCTFSVTVTGATEGAQVNLTGNVNSTQGGQGGTASDTVTVINPPNLTKSFTPNQIQLNSTSSLQFTLSNPNTTLGLNTLAFTDSLPSGVTAPNTEATTVCTDGSYSISANVISFSKPSLAAGANCVFSVTVTGTTAGLKMNTTSTVTASNSDAGAAATANLTVIAPPTIAKSFAPTSVLVNETSVLTISIINPSDNTIALTGVSVTDNFPSGVEVDSMPSLINSCSTGTFAPTAGATSAAISGATIPVNTTCTFSVQVKATSVGAKNNVTGNVSSTEGGTGATASATLTVTANTYEADVAPRFDGSGDGFVNAGDITQVRRFVAGLDQPFQSNEFQRADSAPLNILGDGFINAGDITQARRYAAGLDAVQPAGGPTTPAMMNNLSEVEKRENFADSDEANSGQDDEANANRLSDFERTNKVIAAPREVRPTRVLLSGNVLTVGVNLNTDAADTPANAVGFTLLFDIAVLSNPTNIRLGMNAPAATTITENTTQAAMGRVGIVLDLPVSPPQTFPTGDAQFVLIDFTVAPMPPASTTLSFGDTPVQQFVGDINGNSLMTTFSSGSISLVPVTAASVSIGGRVMTEGGRGIARAVVTLIEQDGTVRRAFTNPFGYFRFTNVQVGTTYIFSVRHKQFTFSPQVVTVNDEITDLNFVSLPNADNDAREEP